MRKRLSEINPLLLCLLTCAFAACVGQTDATRQGDEGKQVKNIVTPATLNLDLSPSPPIKTGDIDQSRYGSRALSYLQAHGKQYGIHDATAELAFVNEVVDDRRQVHVRFQQVKDGVPVWGHQLIVHIDDARNRVVVSGSFLMGIDDVNVHPGLTRRDAETSAVLVMGQGWRAVGGSLYVFEYESQAKLVYYVTVTRGMERWFVVVDAHDGDVLRKISGMPGTAPQ